MNESLLTQGGTHNSRRERGVGVRGARGLEEKWGEKHTYDCLNAAAAATAAIQLRGSGKINADKIKKISVASSAWISAPLPLSIGPKSGEIWVSTEVFGSTGWEKIDWTDGVRNTQDSIQLSHKKHLWMSCYQLNGWWGMSGLKTLGKGVFGTSQQERRD